MVDVGRNGRTKYTHNVQKHASFFHLGQFKLLTSLGMSNQLVER